MDYQALEANFEARAFALGTARVDKHQLRLVNDGRTTDGALGVISRALPAVTGAVQSWLDEHAAKTRGRPPAALAAIQAVGPDRGAFIALSQAFGAQAASKHQPDIRRVSYLTGRMVEDELWGSTLRTQDPKLYSKVFAVAKRNTKLKTRIKAAKSVAAAGTKDKDGKVVHAPFKVEPWRPSKAVLVGGALLNIVLKSCDVFGLEEIENAVVLVMLTPAARQEVLGTHERMAWQTPIHQPMVVKPRDWTGLGTGAYMDRKLAKTVPLVRGIRPPQAQMFRENLRSGKAAPFMEAINAIQATAFEVNAPILEMVEWSYTNDVKVSDGDDFPRRTHEPVPDRLPDDVWAGMTDRQKKGHRIKLAEIKKINRAVDADAMTMDRDLRTAKDLLGLPFYLPHNADFRSRFYPVPSYNYQRADHLKAQFRFYDGMPLGDTGAFWLAVHLANCGDFDKVSKAQLADRVGWVYDNEELIISTAEQAQDDLRWTDADSPFLFMAACREWRDYVASGESPEFVSHLPISLDGSNSGLQHYSALLRAEKDGAFVNLTAHELPADIYAEVARRVTDAVKADVGGEFHIVACKWLAYGLERKLVKRNVMTFPYSSNVYGFRDQHMKDLMKPLNRQVLKGDLDVHPFGDDWEQWAEAAGYLAKKVWEAVNATVSKAAEGMSFLKKLAAALAHEKKPVVWTTPTGFPVVHEYHEWERHQVKLWFDERGAKAPRCYQPVLNDAPSDRLDKGKQKSAVSPNFIHSHDASHVALAVLKAKREGIKDFFLIHDSFGTHAANTGRFFQIIRETFVDVYEQNDPLQAIYDTAYEALSEKGRSRLALPPQKGSLDLRSVLKSDYAFA